MSRSPGKRLPTPEEASARYAHGTYARYRLGKCRCFDCRVAVANYVYERNARRSEVIPYRLRCFSAGKWWHVIRR